MSDKLMWIALAALLLMFCANFIIGTDRMFFDSAGSIFIKNYFEMNNN